MLRARLQNQTFTPLCLLSRVSKGEELNWCSLRTTEYETSPPWECCAKVFTLSTNPKSRRCRAMVFGFSAFFLAF
jgi:hypothetical protein